MWGIIGFILSVLLGIIFTTGDEDIPDLIFSFSYIISLFMIIILSFFNNYNQTQNYHSLALASKSDRDAIMIRSENMLIELNALLSNQMTHEDHIYLNVGKSSIKEITKKSRKFSYN